MMREPPFWYDLPCDYSLRLDMIQIIRRVTPEGLAYLDTTMWVDVWVQ